VSDTTQKILQLFQVKLLFNLCRFARLCGARKRTTISCDAYCYIIMKLSAVTN